MTPEQQFKCKWHLLCILYRIFPNRQSFRQQHKLSVYQVRRSHTILENHICEKLGIQQAPASRMNLVYSSDDDSDGESEKKISEEELSMMILKCKKVINRKLMEHRRKLKVKTLTAYTATRSLTFRTCRSGLKYQ